MQIATVRLRSESLLGVFGRAQRVDSRVTRSLAVQRAPKSPATNDDKAAPELGRNGTRDLESGNAPHHMLASLDADRAIRCLLTDGSAARESRASSDHVTHLPES